MRTTRSVILERSDPALDASKIAKALPWATSHAADCCQPGRMTASRASLRKSSSSSFGLSVGFRGTLMAQAAIETPRSAASGPWGSTIPTRADGPIPTACSSSPIVRMCKFNSWKESGAKSRPTIAVRSGRCAACCSITSPIVCNAECIGTPCWITIGMVKNCCKKSG